ncbi:50S ribosomal protein L18 [Candidatus Dependentiae bacterium]|nr:50S ribosomal protein L18 [Candidatus Dependentiae bacterium]
MSLLKKIQVRTVRRTFRVRNAQLSRGERVRISVHRTLKQIYAQAIDDKTHQTVASFSSQALGKKVQGDKKEQARQVGLELGKMLLQKNHTSVFFDRGQFLYHGRVKSLADGLRESGLQF